MTSIAEQVQDDDRRARSRRATKRPSPAGSCGTDPGTGGLVLGGLRHRRSPVPPASRSASAAAFAAFRSLMMWTPADTSGAASTRPIIPKRQPAPIVTMRTTSGFRLSVAPKAIGWRMFWSSPFASRTMSNMMSAVSASARTQREDDGERAGHECPDVRHVCRDERDERDRSGKWDAEDDRSEPDDHRVERGDDRDAAEVAPEGDDDVARDRVGDRGRHAQMLLTHRRIDRAVLQQEEEREKRERQTEREARERLDPVDRTADERAQDRGDVRLRVARRGRCSRGIHSGILQPALDLRGGFVRRRADLVHLRDDPADDEAGHEERDREEREQHDHRAEPLAARGGAAAW